MKKVQKVKFTIANLDKPTLNYRYYSKDTMVKAFSDYVNVNRIIFDDEQTKHYLRSNFFAKIVGTDDFLENRENKEYIYYFPVTNAVITQ